MILFTDREIQNAWRQNHSAYENVQQKTNAHRLLLFYSVECGLKAVIMKRERKNRTDLCHEFRQSQHDINKLLDHLKAGSKLKLPNQFNMKFLKNEQQLRNCKIGELNQMWRYGGCAENLDQINDAELEKKLVNILTWIEQELR